LALQAKFAGTMKVPLCIMTSNDTNPGTVKLLEENNYFGMDKDQLTIVQQGDGVPALLDNDAKISMESPFKVATKPHGHGDVHALIYSNGVAKKWVAQGVKWLTFFQDTNGLAFHTLPLALGVSTKYDLIMNSLTIPRKAKQAVGAITKLTNTATKEERYVTCRLKLPCFVIARMSFTKQFRSR
jgi:UDP-sugar pyrophosphorylase